MYQNQIIKLIQFYDIIINQIGVGIEDFPDSYGVLQIDNEIVRISSGLNPSTWVANVLRGVLGTKAESHANTAVAREVKPVATELRRYSTVRASGHTF